MLASCPTRLSRLLARGGRKALTRDSAHVTCRREARQHRQGTRAAFVDEDDDELVVATGPSEVPAAPSNRPSESWRVGFLDQVIALRKVTIQSGYLI